MTTAAPRYLSAGSTDQGYVRPNNEDRVYCNDARGLFLVVDGMGGHEAGEHAAQIAVEHMRVRLERQTDGVEQRVREAIALANNAIYRAARENPEWSGMACVLTAVVIEDGQITAGHVGDSRLYRIKRGLIEKMTHDHSPVGEREDRGELSEREAMQHPRRNEVYRDVGSEERTPDARDFIEIVQMPFEPDSALLLCSDGLSDAISSEAILRIVEENAGDRWGTVRALISAANQVGKDNVSTILVEGEAFAASFGRQAAPGEDTERVTVTQQKTRSSWHRSGAAYLLYGAILGALVAFGIEAFLTQKKIVRLSKSLLVTAPGTITAALEKARPGSTILVSPGTYSESVRLKDGVTLSAERAHEAVIEGAVTANNVQQARLEGFDIRGGVGGVRIRDSDVVLSRDEVAGSLGMGVEFTGNSHGAIIGCFIHNNAGGGILVTDAAAPAIENNVIEGNGAQADVRPGLFIRSRLRPSIVRNTFIGNAAEPVWLAAPDDAVMRRNYFLVPGNSEEQPKVRIVTPGNGVEENRP